MDSKVLENLVNVLRADGGFTIEHRLGTVPELRRYIWSPRKDAERRYRFGLTGQEISQYIAIWRDTLYSSPRLFVGGWHNQGIDYLDLMTDSDDLHVALSSARLARQLAIYDRQTGQDIFLNR